MFIAFSHPFCYKAIDSQWMKVINSLNNIGLLNCHSFILMDIICECFLTRDNMNWIMQKFYLAREIFYVPCYVMCYYVTCFQEAVMFKKGQEGLIFVRVYLIPKFQAYLHPGERGEMQTQKL